MLERRLMPGRRAPASFKVRLQFARDKRGLTQDQLAKKAGCSARSIYLYEAGERSPQLDQFAVLCEALDVSADFLCGRKEWVE